MKKPLAVLFAFLLVTGIASASYSMVDGFEDQDYSEYTGDTGEFGFNSNFVTEGSYSMSWYDSGDGAHAITSSSGLNAYPARGDNYTFDFRFENNTAAGGRIVPEIGRGGGDSEHFYVRYDIGEQHIYAGETEGGSTSTASAVFAEDVWYNAKLQWYENDTMTASAYYDTNGSLIASTSVTANDIVGTDIGWVASAIDGDTYGYVDNVQAGSPATNSAPTVLNEDPVDGATGVNDTVDGSPVDVNLSVEVEDSDNSTLDVYFFDGSDTLIGSKLGVSNNSRTEVLFEDLSEGNAYDWYVKVDDGVTNTTSSTFTFSTESSSSSGSGTYNQLASSFINFPLNDTAFDSTIEDFSGQNNDGTAIDTSSINFGATGVSKSEGLWDTGEAVEFDGTEGSQISFPNTGGLCDGSNDFTKSFWMKPTASQTDSYVASFSGECEWHYRYNVDGNNKLKLQTYDGSTENNLFSQSSIAIGDLVHVVSTYDASTNEAQLYINGSLDNSNSIPAPVSLSDRNELGDRSNDGEDREYIGLLDNFRVYSKTANSTEVSNLFNYNSLQNESEQTSDPGSDYSVTIDSPADQSIFEIPNFEFSASASTASDFYYNFNGSSNISIDSTVTSISESVSKKDGVYELNVWGVNSSNTSITGKDSIEIEVDAFYQSRFEDGYGENVTQYQLGIQQEHKQFIPDSAVQYDPRGAAFISVAYHDSKNKFFGVTQANLDTPSGNNAFELWSWDSGVEQLTSSNSIGLLSHSDLESYNCLNQNFHEPTLRENDGSLLLVFAAQQEGNGGNSEICMIENNISVSGNQFTDAADWIGNSNNPLITQLPTGNSDVGDPEFYEYTDGTWRIQAQQFDPDTSGEAWQWKSSGTDPMTSYSVVNSGNPIIDITNSLLASEDDMHPWSVFVNEFTGELFTISAYVDDSAGVKYHEWGFPILGDNVDQEWQEEYVDYRMVDNFQIELSGSTNEFAREFDHTCKGSENSRTCEVFYTAGHWIDDSNLNFTVAQTDFYKNTLMVENRFQNNDTGSWSYTSGNKTSPFTGSAEAGIYGSNISVEFRTGSTASDVVSSSFESVNNEETVSLDSFYQYRVSSNTGGSEFQGLEFTVDVAPSITIDSPQNQTYSSSSIDLNVTSDEAVSTWEYSLDGAANQTFTPNTTISGLSDGSHQLDVYATDSNGDTGSESVTFSVDTTDSTPPTSSDNWSASGFVDKSKATVELTATDSGGSGVEDIYYRVNGGSYSVVQGSSATVTISSQGNNTLEYYAEDSVGNTEATNTEFVALESNSAPSASFTTTTNDLTVSVDASGSSDSDGSISSYEWDWTNDGTYEGSGETQSHTYGSEGTYNVKLRVTDNDGAVDTQVETISVSSGTDDGGDSGGGGGGTTDTTPPDTTDNWDVSGFLDKTQAAVSLSATDSGVGVDRIEYQINGNGFTSVSGNSASVDIFTEGNNTLEYYAVDNNGNEEQTQTEYVAFKTSTDDGGSGGDGDGSQGTVSLQLDSPQGDIDKNGATEISQTFDTTVDVNNSGTLELQISTESQTGFTAVDGKAIGINSDQTQQFSETFKVDYSNISESKQVSEEISYRLEWQGDDGYSLASSVQKFRYINNIGGSGNNATGLFSGVPSGLGVYLLLVLLLGVLALPLLIKVRLND